MKRTVLFNAPGFHDCKEMEGESEEAILKEGREYACSPWKDWPYMAFRRGDGSVSLYMPPPIPMVLYCPRCGFQHIDEPNEEKGWDNPPHRSHECQGCGTVWRPADVPTAGVAAIATASRNDTWYPLVGLFAARAKLRRNK